MGVHAPCPSQKRGFSRRPTADRPEASPRHEAPSHNPSRNQRLETTPLRQVVRRVWYAGNVPTGRPERPPVSPPTLPRITPGSHRTGRLGDHVYALQLTHGST